MSISSVESQDWRFARRTSCTTRTHFKNSGDSQSLVADAKARIAIYVSPDAVQRLASFVRKGAVLDTPERWKEFAAICQAFRRDGRPKLGKIPDEDMTVLLFK